MLPGLSKANEGEFPGKLPSRGDQLGGSLDGFGNRFGQIFRGRNHDLAGAFEKVPQTTGRKSHHRCSGEQRLVGRAMPALEEPGNRQNDVRSGQESPVILPLDSHGTG